jgi:ElaB/YqjD/DUF883 family membrane-anchored ribosome-binding protein
MAERDLQKDMEAIKEDMAQLRSDLAELTQRLVDMGKDEISTARNRVRARARTIGQGLRETLNDTGERGLKTVESVEQLLAERPVISLLAAFGLGLFVGKLLDRR